MNDNFPDDFICCLTEMQYIHFDKKQRVITYFWVDKLLKTVKVDVSYLKSRNNHLTILIVLNISVLG